MLTLHICTLQPSSALRHSQTARRQLSPAKANAGMPATLPQPELDLCQNAVHKHSSKWDDFVEPDSPDLTASQESPPYNVIPSCTSPPLPLQAVENMPPAHFQHAKPTGLLHTSAAKAVASNPGAGAVHAAFSSIPHQQQTVFSPSDTVQAQLDSGSPIQSLDSAQMKPTLHNAHLCPPRNVVKPVMSTSRQQQPISRTPVAGSTTGRQGFKPPALVAPAPSQPDQGIKTSRTQKPNSAGVSTDALLSFFGPNKGPALRYTDVPTSFASLQQYKQVWTSAVTEELSIRSAPSKCTTCRKHCHIHVSNLHLLLLVLCGFDFAVEASIWPSVSIILQDARKPLAAL